MRLSEFMVPDVVPRQDIRWVAEQRMPSPLFSAYSPEQGLLLVNGGLLSVPAGPSADQLATRYKSLRNEQFLASLPEAPRTTAYWDMEDARGFSPDVFFGRPLNVFQYNRRIGDRTAVLWRLRSYFEPSLNLGHPGVVVQDNVEFADKRAHVVWRGGLTGSRWKSPHERVGIQSVMSEDRFAAGARYYSRIAAVLEWGRNEAFDFKFTGGTEQNRSWLQSMGALGEPMRPEQLLESKYVLCPNGNDVSSGLYWLLNTNSVALREECFYEVVPDYFLRPWVHYVPIARGLDDLREKWEYCEAHPDLCRTILENAKMAYEQITASGLWEEAEREVMDRLGIL